MNEIDKNIVKRIIDENIGHDYTIGTITNTSKYIFINYKHKIYQLDDERGQLIGTGPIAFNRETSEYKILGSGDYITSDYIDYLPKETERNQINEKINQFDNIVVRIKKRNYINTDEYYYLLEILEKEYNDFQAYIKMDRNLDLSSHFLFEYENSQHKNRIIEIWKIIQFPYAIRNGKEIILYRSDKTSCQ